MKLPDQCNWDGAANLRLGADEDGEELHAAEPAGVVIIGEEGEEERAESEQGAAAAEGTESGAEEASEGSESDSDDWDFMDDESYETSGDSGGEIAERELEELLLQAGVQCPQPADGMQVAHVASFTEEQEQELEQSFLFAAYPCKLVRQDIARRMNVPEARVQIWFHNRRTKDWRNQRLLMLKKVPPAILDHTYFRMVEKP